MYREFIACKKNFKLKLEGHQERGLHSVYCSQAPLHGNSLLAMISKEKSKGNFGEPHTTGIQTSQLSCFLLLLKIDK